MRSTTADSLIKQLSTEECLSFIKNRLNAIQELPSEGFVAGQAVASAVVEYLRMDNLINPVYNDIDIFRYIKKKEMTVEQARRFSGKANGTAMNKAVASDNGPYGHLTESFYYQDKIIDSIQIGEKINETTVMRLQQPNNNGLYTLKNFDINSTQVGFAIGDDRLSFTPDFILFLVTRELQISNLSTPLHSIIRLYKKHAELGGVYADFKTNELLAYTQASFSLLYKNQITPRDANGSVHYHPVFFGEKHKDDFFKYGVHEKGHFLFQEEVIRKVSSTDRDGNDPEPQYVSAILNTLAVPSVSDDFYDYASRLNGLEASNHAKIFMDILGKKKDMSSYGVKDIYNLSLVPANTHRMKRVRKSASSIVSSVSYYQRLLAQVVHEEKDILGLALDVNVDVMKETLALAKFFDGHSLGSLEHYLSFSGMEPHEKLSILRNIKIVDCETEILIGELESRTRRVRAYDNTEDVEDVDYRKFQDLEYVRAYAEKCKVGLMEPLKKRGVEFTLGDYTVSELITPMELKKEGRSMNHCVGGYSHSVKSGASIIVGISCRDMSLTKEERKYHSFTLELRKSYPSRRPLPFEGKLYNQYKEPYYISQLHSYSNKKGMFRTDLVEVFDQISEVYPTGQSVPATLFNNETDALLHFPSKPEKRAFTLAYRTMKIVDKGLVKTGMKGAWLDAKESWKEKRVKLNNLKFRFNKNKPYISRTGNNIPEIDISADEVPF